MRWMIKALLSFWIALPAQAACFAEQTSPRPHLLELYTSEGCSSCPPADEWLSKLRGQALFAPLEFHVDYWDSEHWRDPYADPRFTARQRELVKRGARDLVYTPQFTLDGRVWKGWPKSRAPEPDTARAPALRLDLVQRAPLRVRVVTDAPSAEKGDQTFVALTEDGLSNAVNGGENRGATLRHDHVVRAFAGPLAPGGSEIDLAAPKDVELGRSALVAFVQNERDGRVVQVVRLPLADCAP